MENKSNYNIYGAAITVVVAALSFWFWAYLYSSGLGYREEMQLFQCGSSYLASHLGIPGGMAVYVGEFLTQFCAYRLAGALIMAVLTGLFYLSTVGMCRGPLKAEHPGIPAAVAALAPVVGLWLYMGNPNVTVAFFIVALTATAGSCAFRYLNKYQVMLAETALLYWLIGPMTVVLTLSGIVYVWIDKRNSLKSKFIFTIAAPAWLAVNVAVWSMFVTFPLSYQLIGIGYNLNPDTFSLGQLAIVALCAAAPAVAVTVASKRKIMLPALLAAEVAAGVLLFPKAYDRTTYELLDYDRMVCANDWEGILRYSDEHDPKLPMSVSATNLALGMTGQLDSRAFDYYQHGAEGLVPPFAKETLSSWTTGEIFYQLGMVNSAQRFYFEGMEAIPNYNKSPRALKRLAECAMIRGEYAVARKYLGLLANTTLHRKWARRKLDLLNSPAKFMSHPVYGRMRKGMVDEDYLFSEGELDKTFGQLFLKNPGNHLAKQYLVVWPLLQRDLNKFGEYMGVVAEEYPKYNPLLAQQAMAFISMKNQQPIPQQIVPPAVEQQLRNFARAWTSKKPDMIAPYRRTLFHYLLSEN